MNATEEEAPPLGRLGKVTLFLLVVLTSVITLEATARVYWSLCCKIPLTKPGVILFAFYPELKEVARARPKHDDKFYDVLLLGGSVLNNRWGYVEKALFDQLNSIGRRNVRVFNLAMPAHTSRDSWLKYAYLKKARFELVFFYHALNETRTNNAPPQIFREDYEHYPWYEIVNTLASYQGARFSLPYTMHYLFIRMRQELRKDQYIPTLGGLTGLPPRAEWLQFGDTPRSAVSFERNLSAIIDLAEHRGDQLCLMTYAIYVPENYSLEAFQAKQLDYGWHLSPVEIWGRPHHVTTTVAIHNEIVRSLAAKHPGVLFVDQAKLMEHSGRYFNDPAHLTDAGSLQFVENLRSVLLHPTQRLTKNARTREGSGPTQHK